MSSMLILGGLGACPLRKMLNTHEIESEGILQWKYFIMCITVEIQNKYEMKSHFYQHHCGMQNIATESEQVIIPT